MHDSARSLILVLGLIVACGGDDDDGGGDTQGDDAATTPDDDGATMGNTAPMTMSDATMGADDGDDDAPGSSSSGEADGSSSGGDGTSSEGGDSTTGTAAVTASVALAELEGSGAGGSGVFTLGKADAELVIELAGVMPPGTHALHIHEFADCSGDGTAAGMHWNPKGTQLGELGTVDIAEDGTGTFTKTDAWTVGDGGEADVVGKSIIIHADPDGGARIACGIIELD